MKRNNVSPLGSIRILILAALVLLPVLTNAQLFTFSVDDLEAYDRTGNWIYDADGPTFPTHDANWFSYSPAPAYAFHYFAEKYIHMGLPTVITCTAENVPLAANPGEISMVFNQFNLVAFNRINTVNPLAPWNTPGQSGDQRVYANATGYIAHNGNPVLYMNNATFVITTPYPNQAQIQALNPLFAGWTGNIGTGAPQTGYGFGDLDLTMSDPTWAALFAASNYKIELEMLGITSWVTPTMGYFDFTLNVSPAPIPRITGNALVDLGNLPDNLSFPGVDADVEVTGGTPGGPAGDMLHIYLNEIGVQPAGILPPGLNYTAKKYWELGSTMANFNVNINFTLTMADFAKAPADWRVLYRSSPAASWTLWNDFTLSGPNTITANNVNQIGEFTIASPFDETLPVELTGFYSAVNSQNMAVIYWSTASETDMLGFKVYANDVEDFGAALCLTPSAITAHNSSSGSSYTYTANEITEAGTYWFWLESISLGGSSDIYGPVSITLQDQPGVPELPARSALGNAYPNPFKQGQNAAIAVDIKSGETGVVSIYNLSGQLVRSYRVQPGSHVINWNGRDTRGNACASGIYLYRLSTPSFSGSGKMVIVK